MVGEPVIRVGFVDSHLASRLIGQRYMKRRAPVLVIMQVADYQPVGDVERQAGQVVSLHRKACRPFAVEIKPNRGVSHVARRPNACDRSRPALLEDDLFDPPIRIVIADADVARIVLVSEPVGFVGACRTAVGAGRLQRPIRRNRPIDALFVGDHLVQQRLHAHW